MLISLASCYPLRSFTSPAVIGFFGWQRETDLWCKLMYTINQRTTNSWLSASTGAPLPRTVAVIMNTNEQTFPVVKVFLFTRHYSFLLHRLCSECDNLLIFSEACLLFFELSPPSVIFTRVSCWQQFVWRHHQPVVSLCVRMNSFSYSNSP